MPTTAVFFDRDGTLIHDCSYLSSPEQVQLLPGAKDLLRWLQGRRIPLVVVSNQSGIGRGFITEAQARAVHFRFSELLAESGISLRACFYCPHAPEAGCECRKPQPGLLLRAAEDLGIDLSNSFMVGDKPSDCEAGSNAGCKPILLSTARRSTAATNGYEVVTDLAALLTLFKTRLT
jgi:D-glycero-D-manno-heptose 1,7-bisphosphate phosphatase